jgi:hypothetical protein
MQTVKSEESRLFSWGAQAGKVGPSLRSVQKARAVGLI